MKRTYGNNPEEIEESFSTPSLLHGEGGVLIIRRSRDRL